VAVKLAAGALALGLLTGWWFTGEWYQGKIERLDAEVSMLDKANAEFKASVSNQNEAILALNEYANDRASAYAELLNTPEKVRFKTKYVEIKSNECEAVRLIFDDIRSAGF
jgi:hypothetical protein